MFEYTFIYMCSATILDSIILIIKSICEYESNIDSIEFELKH